MLCSQRHRPGPQPEATHVTFERRTRGNPNHHDSINRAGFPAASREELAARRLYAVRPGVYWRGLAFGVCEEHALWAAQHGQRVTVNPLLGRTR